ncbi:hypothetical protein D3C86_1736770 [compost metagenome]
MIAEGGVPSPPIIRSVMIEVSVCVRTKAMVTGEPATLAGTSTYTTGSLRTVPSSLIATTVERGEPIETCLLRRIDRVVAPEPSASAPTSSSERKSSGVKASLMLLPLPRYPPLR